MTGFDYIKSGEIEDRIMSRDWTLNDVLNMEDTVDIIVQELIDSLDYETKYLIVKDYEWQQNQGDVKISEIISYALREELSDMVSFIVNQYLKEAKVSFNNNTKPKVIEEVKEEKETQEDKIITLKERIKQDTKKLSEKEMKKKGLI